MFRRMVGLSVFEISGYATRTGLAIQTFRSGDNMAGPAILEAIRIPGGILMRKIDRRLAVAASSMAILLTACSSGDDAAESGAAGPASFFVTSENPGKGGNLGGIGGADAWCQYLAGEAGLGDSEWKAYLSLGFVDARDRIGDGPWYNVNGVLIAGNVDQLHTSNNITNETALDENGNLPDYLHIVDGEVVRRDENSLVHDVLTGSNEDGTANEATCNGWTNGTSMAQAMLGHADRLGRTEGVNSWNAVHASQGCDMPSLVATGGAGMYYCFAID